LEEACRKTGWQVHAFCLQGQFIMSRKLLLA
jgi:hypothetical protein